MNEVRPSDTERRRWPRSHPPGRTSIECRLGSPGTGPDLVDSIVDLSPIGVGLVIRQKLQPRERVEVTLDDGEKDDSLRLTAEVVWSTPVEKGCHLTGLFFLRKLNRDETERFL
jgi:hypothetical protein